MIHTHTLSISHTHTNTHTHFQFHSHSVLHVICELVRWVEKRREKKNICLVEFKIYFFPE